MGSAPRKEREDARVVELLDLVEHLRDTGCAQCCQAANILLGTLPAPDPAKLYARLCAIADRDLDDRTLTPSEALGCLDDVVLDDDGPDGLFLVLTSDVGESFRLRVTDAEGLVAAVEPLRRHLRDGEAVRRERESWAGHDLSDASDEELAAYGERLKPVTAAQFDWLAHAGDIHRKAEKGRRP